MLPDGAVAQENAHRWTREEHEHYVEPEWCSVRLFEEERFDEMVWDPFCGFGRIPAAAKAAGYLAAGSDIVDRGYNGDVFDFWRAKPDTNYQHDIVSNPPFEEFKSIALRCLTLTKGKVALLWLVRTLPAPGSWLKDTPLSKILYLTPRPSMPPGHVIAAGGKPGGGKQDFCWLIWDHAHKGPATVGWLHRDKT